MANPLRVYAESLAPADPAVLPLVVDAHGLAAMLAVGLRTIRGWDAAGKIPAALRLGNGSVRWRVDEIRDWLTAGGPRRSEWEARKAASRK